MSADPVALVREPVAEPVAVMPQPVVVELSPWCASLPLRRVTSSLAPSPSRLPRG